MVGSLRAALVNSTNPLAKEIIISSSDLDISDVPEVPKKLLFKRPPDSQFSKLSGQISACAHHHTKPPFKSPLSRGLMVSNYLFACIWLRSRLLLERAQLKCRWSWRASELLRRMKRMHFRRFWIFPFRSLEASYSHLWALRPLG